MPRQSKSARLAEIHETALRQFEASWSASWPDRQAALDARRFVDVRGAQWDWDVDKFFKSRMRLEINKVALACTRINNEYKANEVEARFIPKDGADADPLADFCASRYRADFQDSNGKEARDNAFDEMIKGGFGAVRYRTDYESKAKGYLRVCIEPVHDAVLSIYFDANAKRADKSDAEHAFHIRPYTREAYEAIWGTEVASWPEHMRGRFKFDWFGADLIYVAEYFVKEHYTETRRSFMGIDGSVEEIFDSELTPEELEELMATGYVEGEPEKVEAGRIHKYTLSGAGVLSDDGIIAGKIIPIAPCYAYRSIIDGVERFRGHVTMAMDPQIAMNIQFSKVAEIAAQSPVSKPILMAEQVAGHEDRWKNDHIENYAYMLLNPMYDAAGNPIPAGEIGRTMPPEIPPAVGALYQMGNQDLADILGNPANGEVIAPNGSGVQTEMVQNRLDMQTSGYVANLGDMERTGAAIWLSMATDIYTEKGRKLKTMSDSGARGSVEIGKEVFDPETGKQKAELDFQAADFDIAVEVGPSSLSRRNAIVRSMTSLLGVATDPETQSVLTHSIIMNMEGQGLEDARKWSRNKLVAMGVIAPTKEEQAKAEAAQGQGQPSSQDQLAVALAEKAKADAEVATAKVGDVLAGMELKQAQTAKTLAEIPGQQEMNPNA